MNELLTKSDINQASAELLHKQNYYCSTVHCAYYSCVQLMRYILITNLGKSEIQIKSERIALGEDSHVYMINQVAKYLRTFKNPDAVVFLKNINKLKKLRVESDYENVQIDFDKGRSSILIADESNKILKKVI